VADPSAPRSPFAPWTARAGRVFSRWRSRPAGSGHYAWIEMRLFEALGGWVATVPELDVRRAGPALATTTLDAELWHKRLPELAPEMPPRPADPAAQRGPRGFRRRPDRGRGPRPHHREAGRGLPGAAPRKIAAYTYHLAATSRVHDARRSGPSGSSSRTRRRTGGRGDAAAGPDETDAEVDRAARRQSALRR